MLLKFTTGPCLHMLKARATWAQQAVLCAVWVNNQGCAITLCQEVAEQDKSRVSSKLKTDQSAHPVYRSWVLRIDCDLLLPSNLRVIWATSGLLNCQWVFASCALHIRVLDWWRY